jgi:nitrate reductase gamma subunit
MGVIQLLVYACVLVFVIAVALKVVRYASAPVHMRWELYPVAHEKGRHHYGGSFFEEPDWWEKKRQVDHVNEVREMMQEILLLKGVRLNNRKIWVYSFPFHFGLYLVVGWMALLVVGGIMELGGTTFDAGVPAYLRALTQVVGFVGMALTALGALGLFFFRAGNADMRRFNAPADYLHLLWFVGAGVLGIVAYAVADPAFDALRGFVASSISFQPAAPLAPGVATAVACGMLLVAYIPFTRMVHFAAKYFLYHDVRWSDEPLSSGIQSRVMRALDYGVSWRAPHIQTGKSWAEVATTTEEKE